MTESLGSYCTEVLPEGKVGQYCEVSGEPALGIHSWSYLSPVALPLPPAFPGLA